jgi:protein involved in polysaccharide export with SLBB domain
MKITRIILVTIAVLFLAVDAAGQVAPPNGAYLPKINCDSSVLNSYQLGPDDELEISGAELDEPANKSTRIDGNGAVQVPLLGRVHVAGLTVAQAEQEERTPERIHSTGPNRY